MKPVTPGICDFEDCAEPELTQGRCYDHCILCPRCGTNPCNGSVPDPYCNNCIQAEAEKVTVSFEECDHA